MTNLLNNHDKEERPWGSFERFTLNEYSTVKFLRLLPGKRISLQRHEKRAEFWRVISGSGTAEVGGEARAVAENDDVHIPQGVAHRLSAGPEGVLWLEIAFGEFDEHDEERLDDDFGRT